MPPAPKTQDELFAMAAAAGVALPWSDDTSVLCEPWAGLARPLPNRMIVHPMEGFDSTDDGGPSELAFRRYHRFAAGGAGLLWFEATAVLHEARSNAHQLWLHEGNKAAFARLLEEAKQKAAEAMGPGHVPYCVLQLTHSGRYSRPEGTPAPIIAHHDAVLDPAHDLPPNYPLVTDGELERIEDAFVAAARIAYDIGFDSVDVKSCHRYLMNELLAAHTREGRYGGSYENRTRFAKNIIGKIHAELGADKAISPRLGVYDGIAYPYGWGVKAEDGSLEMDLSEPIRFIGELRDMGVKLVNVTMGNPYHNPHVNRPYSKTVKDLPDSPENPIIGAARILNGAAEVQAAHPDVAMIGSGISWLRDLWPNVAAGALEQGLGLIGLGRQAFAYPFFAKEILDTGTLARQHTCITCAACTWLMRKGGPTGCPQFDQEGYAAIYQRLRGQDGG